VLSKLPDQQSQISHNKQISSGCQVLFLIDNALKISLACGWRTVPSSINPEFPASLGLLLKSIFSRPLHVASARLYLHKRPFMKQISFPPVLCFRTKASTGCPRRTASFLFPEGRARSAAQLDSETCTHRLSCSRETPGVVMAAS
jgi:hypothetical protein